MATLQLVLIVLLISFFSTYLYTLKFHPLSRFPGPIWARLSRTFLMYHVYRGNVEEVQLELHKRYGRIVRIAPDELSVSDPEAIKIIYSTKGDYIKTDFYDAFSNGGIFPEKNEKLHTRMRRLVSPLFALSNVVRAEGDIDECSELLLKRFSEFADRADPIDLGEWLELYAFDVIGKMFFGREFGFMAEYKDTKGFSRMIHTLMGLCALSGVTPWYGRPFLMASSLLLRNVREGIKGIKDIQAYARASVAERQKQRKSDENLIKGQDFLESELAMTDELGPTNQFTVEDVNREAADALFAGAESTAIAFRTVFFHLARNRQALDELVRELDQATSDGDIGSGRIDFAEAVKLPYLSAVIKEALRIHPGVGMSLPRHVPAEGATMAGSILPPGARVGINAAVVHHDTEIFGSDAAEFNPARWLSPDASRMEKYLLHFGGGKRTCMGQHISRCELFKLIPEIVRQFDFEIDHTSADWRTRNSWFHKQFGLVVKMRKRANL